MIFFYACQNKISRGNHLRSLQELPLIPLFIIFNKDMQLLCGSAAKPAQNRTENYVLNAFTFSLCAVYVKLHIHSFTVVDMSACSSFSTASYIVPFSFLWLNILSSKDDPLTEKRRICVHSLISLLQGTYILLKLSICCNPCC